MGAGLLAGRGWVQFWQIHSFPLNVTLSPAGNGCLQTNKDGRRGHSMRLDKGNSSHCLCDPKFTNLLFALERVSVHQICFYVALQIHNHKTATHVFPMQIMLWWQRIKTFIWGIKEAKTAGIRPRLTRRLTVVRGEEEPIHNRETWGDTDSESGKKSEISLDELLMINTALWLSHTHIQSNTAVSEASSEAVALFLYSA